jgi:hypothetical protein
VENPSYIREKGLKPDYKFYIEHQLTNPITQLFSLVVDQIPGAVAPPGGWTKATPGDRDNAVWNVIFHPAIALADKISARTFGQAVFGATSVAIPRAPRAVGVAPTAEAKPKVQTKLSLFVEKQLSKSAEQRHKKGTNAS